MKNILIPTDFSENSWNAIKYAMQFFKNKKCNFYLLHVTSITNYIDADAPLLTDIESIENTLIKEAKTDLKELLKKIKSLNGNNKHNYITLTSIDYFIDAVRNQVSEKKIDLVVMGTKGATGFKEAMVGSNTGDLITKVQCPVLVVPEDAVFRIPKEIAFPTDYNIYYQTSILNIISGIVKMYNSALRVLHVSKRNTSLTTFQKENQEYLSDYFIDEKHSFHKVTSKKIESGLQCFVESRNIDLIVMVAKNLNLFQQILFKPTVEEISYHTEIPFLVLHE
jgi:nucleotide-binding universal stress UspA family protein